MRIKIHSLYFSTATFETMKKTSSKLAFKPQPIQGMVNMNSGIQDNSRNLWNNSHL